jgi:hypothetical protein
MKYSSICFLLFILAQSSLYSNEPMKSIPVAGNSWVLNNKSLSSKIVTDSGIKNWSDKSTVIRTWFRTERSGMIRLAIRCRVNSGTSSIILKLGSGEKTIDLTGTSFDTIDVGTFEITKSGYQYIDLQGMKRTSSSFAEITDILVSGPATEGKLNFVREDFYFGRRGPSVHLNYQVPPEAANIDWFYSEITVPEGSDVPGSYFMANGFADGYFGIQVNSPTERRILFSVWSPFNTDNPGAIPPEFKITLLKKGKDVITKEFGNEGSGGQSFRKYYWKSGKTYGFLLNGHPSEDHSTDYTAYFYAPETGKWQLIASFRRPKTNNYLKNLYSFLENFIPETGEITRKGLYSNQWVHDLNGKWHELTSIKFTADATARKEARLDYSGGVEDGKFYLKNCGFFDDMTEMNQLFSRPPAGTPPEIDLTKL